MIHKSKQSLFVFLWALVHAPQLILELKQAVSILPLSQLSPDSALLRENIWIVGGGFFAHSQSCVPETAIL